jgi:phospholipase/carboxylesterase
MESFMLPTHVRSRPEEGFYASEVSAVSGPRRLPVLTFLPAGYEPNYPYPLVVFFHGRGGSERQLVHLAPRLSRRNYICLGLRGPEPLGFQDEDLADHLADDLDNDVGDELRESLSEVLGDDCYTWTDSRDDVVEEYVIKAIEQARRTYHIHSERIFLAGLCEGSSLAYRLGLTHPEKFAGVIALNGQLPHGRPLLRLPQVRQLKVLIGHGIANAVVPLAAARDDFRLLYTAGLPTRLHTYPTTNRIHPGMLRDIDRWIIESISED